MKLNIQSKNENRFRLSFLIHPVLLAIFILAAAFLLFPQDARAMSFTAFTISPDTDTKVRLDWSSVPGARIYQLYRDNGSGVLTTVAAINTGTALDPLRYDDSGLSPNTTYTYVIKAYLDDALATKLDEKSAVVTTSKMIRPYGLASVYDINSKIANITWNSSALAAGSVIYSTENGVTGEIATGSTTSASISINGTAPVRIAVKSTDGLTAESDISDAITITPFDAPVISAVSKGGAATISWGSFPYISLFQLERSKWNGASWDTWITVNSSLSGQSAADTPPAGGKYRYRLAAKSGSGYTGYSSISDPTDGLPAPSNLSVTVSSPGAISLTWTNGSGNTAGIQVMRKQQDGSYVQIALLGSSATSYIDTINVSPGAIYTYSVRSYLSASDSSAPVEASVAASLPNVPSQLRASVVSSSGITLSWTDNSANETGFSIERMTDTGAYDAVASVPPNTTEYNDTNVSSGHTYIYRVRAYNALGNSAYSNEVTVSEWDSVAPVDLKVEPVSSSRLDLSWSYTGTESYNTIIERKTGADGTWSVIYTTPLGVLKYSDTGLAPNTIYFYRIRKSMGLGSAGLPYPNNNEDIGAYTFLGNLTLSGSVAANNKIYLTWSGNTGTADVIIERQMSSGAFDEITTVSYQTTGWYDNTGLVPGASYSYRVKAKTPTNKSDYSNVVTVKNLYLDAPSALSATITTNSAVELNWKDNSTEETGFEIWRYVYGSGTYVLYATVDKNITTFTDGTIQKGVQYSYMVRAYVASGALYSPYSNTASVGFGLINPPSNLRYEYISSTQVLLRWTDTSDNESGFRIERKIGPDGSWDVLAWLDPNLTAYNVTNLNPYTKYYFRVRAYSSGSNADSLSDEIMVSTAIPAAPSNVLATALSSSQIKITWKDNSDSEDVFRILRKPANAYYYDVLAEVAKNATSYTDSNLTAGMRYSYKIAAVNSAGSSESPAAEARTNTKGTFSDLKSVPWARDAIENLAGMGVMKGVTPTEFAPGKTLTKADFTAMVVRAFGLETAPVGSLADVKPDKWYYNEIMTAENLGIIEGDAHNRFYPDKAITREEIAVMLFKAMQYSGKSITIYSNSVLEKFSDKNKISPEAVSCVATMVGTGILEGLPGNAIGPKNTATRAQAAVLLYRAMNKQ